MTISVFSMNQVQNLPSEATILNRTKGKKILPLSDINDEAREDQNTPPSHYPWSGGLHKIAKIALPPESCSLPTIPIFHSLSRSCFLDVTLGGALHDIQNTAARETTSFSSIFPALLHVSPMFLQLLHHSFLPLSLSFFIYALFWNSFMVHPYCMPCHVNLRFSTVTLLWLPACFLIEFSYLIWAKDGGELPQAAILEGFNFAYTCLHCFPILGVV